MTIVKDYLGNTKNIDKFTIEIYFKQLVLLENGNADDYFGFKNLLFSSLSSFDANELRQFLGFMSNFCLQMIFNGHSEFLYERLEIYKQGIALNCWTSGVYFSRHQFINIVKTGLGANEKEWVNEFIEMYGSKLAPSIQQKTLHLCKAMVAFEEKAYDEAQQLLFRISRSDDFVHHSLMEVLQIKIYYQNEELTFENFNIHPIHARMKAFNAYLNVASGKKLSNSRQAIYFNFLQILKQIMQIRKKLFSDAKIQNRTIENLHDNCTTLKPLTKRAWLLEQIQLLSAG